MSKNPHHEVDMGSLGPSVCDECTRKAGHYIGWTDCMWIEPVQHSEKIRVTLTIDTTLQLSIAKAHELFAEALKDSKDFTFVAVEGIAVARIDDMLYVRENGSRQERIASWKEYCLSSHALGQGLSRTAPCPRCAIEITNIEDEDNR